MDDLLIINIIFALLFFRLGYLIKYKKRYDLIAGFSDYKSDNEKLGEEYEVERIGNIIGNSAFIFGVILILLSLIKSIHPVLIYVFALTASALYILWFYKVFQKLR